MRGWCGRPPRATCRNCVEGRRLLLGRSQVCLNRRGPKMQAPLPLTRKCITVRPCKRGCRSTVWCNRTSYAMRSWTDFWPMTPSAPPRWAGRGERRRSTCLSTEQGANALGLCLDTKCSFTRLLRSKEAALVQTAPLHGIVARRPFVESADQGMAVTVHSVGLLVSGELGRGAVVVETASGEQRTIASTEVS